MLSPGQSRAKVMVMLMLMLMVGDGSGGISLMRGPVSSDVKKEGDLATRIAGGTIAGQRKSQCKDPAEGICLVP